MYLFCHKCRLLLDYASVVRLFVCFVIYENCLDSAVGSSIVVYVCKRVGERENARLFE